MLFTELFTLEHGIIEKDVNVDIMVSKWSFAIIPHLYNGEICLCTVNVYVHMSVCFKSKMNKHVIKLGTCVGMSRLLM